jgi:hypothetical protein
MPNRETSGKRLLRSLVADRPLWRYYRRAAADGASP